MFAAPLPVEPRFVAPDPLLSAKARPFTPSVAAPAFVPSFLRGPAMVCKSFTFFSFQFRVDIN